MQPPSSSSGSVQLPGVNVCETMNVKQAGESEQAQEASPQ